MRISNYVLNTLKLKTFHKVNILMHMHKIEIYTIKVDSHSKKLTIIGIGIKSMSHNT